MSYITIKLFIKGANFTERWTVRGMWTYLIITIFSCFLVIHNIEVHQNELGKILTSAEYRHAMIPKFIRDIPPTVWHNNGPISSLTISHPISDKSDIPQPIHTKISATPKMEEIISIKSVDILDTSEIKDMLRKHRDQIKVTKRKITELDTFQN